MKSILFVVLTTVIANVVLLYIYHNNLIGSWIVMVSIVIGHFIGGFAQTIYNDEKTQKILKEMRK